jgi:hypothetical protein
MAPPPPFTPVSEAHAFARYCKGSSDAQLLKWWAQYCESQGKFDQALAVYVQGNDVASQVPEAPPPSPATLLRARGDLVSFRFAGQSTIVPGRP